MNMVVHEPTIKKPTNPRRNLIQNTLFLTNCGVIYKRMQQNTKLPEMVSVME